MQNGCTQQFLICEINRIMKNETMLDITLEYTLSQFEEEVINSIISDEMVMEEKISVIMNLDKESKKIILRKMGFKREFLKTI